MFREKGEDKQLSIFYTLNLKEQIKNTANRKKGDREKKQHTSHKTHGRLLEPRPQFQIRNDGIRTGKARHIISLAGRVQNDCSFHQLGVLQGSDGHVGGEDGVEDQVVVDLVGEEEEVVPLAEVAELP